MRSIFHPFLITFTPEFSPALEKIEKHIKDLLKEHDCVILPRMGGIVSIPVQASQDTFKLSPGPVLKKLSFNRMLNYNDGMLVNYIVKKENLTYAEALSEIDEFVSRVQQELIISKRFVIEDIGVLITDADYNIHLEPIHPDETETVNLTKKSSNTVSPDVNDQSEINNEVEVVSEIANPHQKVVNRKRIFISIFFALSAIMIVSLILLNYSDRSNKIVPGSESAENDKAVSGTTEEIPIEEKIMNRQQGSTDNKFIPTELPKTIDEPVVSANPDRFFIVAGSFKSMENSKRKLAELKLEGYANAIIFSENGSNHLVCFKEFGSLPDAEKSLVNIKERHAEAWIFKK